MMKKSLGSSPAAKRTSPGSTARTRPSPRKRLRWLSSRRGNAPSRWTVSATPVPIGGDWSLKTALRGRLAVRQLPLRPHEMARVAVRDPLQIVLVLGLGFPERAGLAHLGDHVAQPQARGVDVGNRLLGDVALLVARVEDLRAVARPDVVSLPVHRGRIVDLEEELEDVAVGDPIRIEDDLHGLSVAVVVLVGGVGDIPARVAH